MSTRPETIHHLTRQLLGAGEIRFKPMFGEYGVYLGAKLVGLVCDDDLFIKPTAEGEREFGEDHLALPYPGSKPSYKIPGSRISDAQWIAEFVRKTAELLPEPKPKPPRKAKPR